MHVNFIKINGGKLSKSLNNFYTLSDLQEKGYPPEAYRMFNFNSSYRIPINFTWEGMDSSLKALIKLKEGYQNHLRGNDEVEEDVITNYEEKFHQAINDDLNMPMAMSIVWDVIKNSKKSKKFAELLLKFDTVLGLKIEEPLQNPLKQVPEEIIELAEKRQKARENKDWAESDKIRDEIAKKGYTIKDTKNGYELT